MHFKITNVGTNFSPIYSQTKQDITKLRYSMLVTHVRRNEVNLPIDKGVESFEIMQPTVNSNFTVESKNPLHNKICQGWNYTCMTVFSDCFEYLSFKHVSYAC